MTIYQSTIVKKNILFRVSLLILSFFQMVAHDFITCHNIDVIYFVKGSAGSIPCKITTMPPDYLLILISDR